MIPRQATVADVQAFRELMDEAGQLLALAREAFRAGRVEEFESTVDRTVAWLGSELTLLLGADAPALRSMTNFRRIGELALDRAGVKR